MAKLFSMLCLISSLYMFGIGDIDLFRHSFVGLSGFIDQCRGQAVGGVGHKRKKGKFVMKDVVTLHQFCESFRSGIY